MDTFRVGGITPLTSIDYPGELAAVIFSQGCPWRCRYCHNSHLIPTSDSNNIDWPDVMDFLKRRSGLLDAVVFSGGEPTLQKTLPNAIKAVKALGFKIGLHTAGCYPDRLNLVLPFIDWVALDIKALAQGYQDITQTPGSGEKAWESLDLVVDSGVDYEIRTTRMPGTSDQDMLDLAYELRKKGINNYVLQGCRTTNCLDTSLLNQISPPIGLDSVHQIRKGFHHFDQRG